MKNLVRMVALIVCFAGLIARADTVTLVTSQSALGANDSVSWSQLGTDGTAVPKTFSATSTLGNTIGGSLATGPGVVCNDAGTNTCYDFTFSDLNDEIWTQDATSSGSNNGPLTLTFPAVSGVGTYIESDLASASQDGTEFTASLAVFDGAILLGTVTESSDSNGDPIYIGAFDSTGTNITSAVLSLTDAALTNGAFISYTPTSFDCKGGHTDPYFCAAASCSVGTNVLQCPEKCYCTAHVSPPATSSICWVNWNCTENYVQIPDTDPSDLANFYVDSVNFAGASSPGSISATVTPEPDTLQLFGASSVMLASLLRRKFFRRNKRQVKRSQDKRA